MRQRSMPRAPRQRQDNPMSLTSLQHTKEWREKVSATHKRLGIVPPSWKGKRHSLETRMKMSLIRKNSPSPGMANKKHSLETRKKMSELRKGIIFSLEHRKKLS